jgi:RHS repeat-associated protein
MDMKTKAGLSTFAICAALCLSTPSGLAGEASYAAQIQMKPVFTSPIEWLGEKEPPEAESLALLNAIRTFDDNGVAAGFAALESYLAAHPKSSWNPSLNINLAERYRSQGRYSLALTHWAAAWNATKDEKNPKGRAMAVRTFAQWTACLLNLGQSETLTALFKELDALQLPQGSFAGQINDTRVQFIRMAGRPGAFYRCGLYALVQFADLEHVDPQSRRQLLMKQAPESGFSLSELAGLAASNGIAVSAVRRPAGAVIPVPCVAHWKLGHYVAILEKKGDNYRVVDPSANGEIWMSQQAIDAESSGAFLLASDKTPASWQRISENQCATIRGRGGDNTIPDPNDCPPCICPPCDQDQDDDQDDPPTADDDPPDVSSDGTDGSPSCCGMAVWRVSEPYINLWLADTPLFYHLSSGRMMSLNVFYKQRGEFKGVNVGSFGPNWECNWIGILEQQPSGVYSNHLAGGGLLQFTIGQPEYTSGRLLGVVSSTSGNIASEDGNASPNGSSGSVSVPVIASSRGTTNRYAYAYTFANGVQYNFLTRRVDRYGRYTQYNYETVNNQVVNGQNVGAITRIRTIVDQDDRTNWVNYTNAIFPNLITSVSDPYNRTNYFIYNTSGLLTNIVDMGGLSSSFLYDSTGVITNLHTGYGNTGFQYLLCNDIGGNICRFLLVTEANTNHQLYAYRDCFVDPGTGQADGSVGVPCTMDGSLIVYRNSFHWNRQQYAVVKANNPAALPGDILSQNSILKLAAADHLNAEVKHWCHGSVGPSTVSDTLEAEAGPVLNVQSGNRVGCVNYSYMGQNCSYLIGTMKQVTSVWIDGGINGNPNLSISRNQSQINAFGRPLTFTILNSDGSVACYANTYDASGRYLQLQQGPRGEMVAGYAYNNPTFPNLLTSVTNAVGDVISYTHDPASLHVTSITFPGGLVRTNLYYGGGSSQGFLQMRADLGFRTNYFAYTNGNISIQTNELGLATTNVWDRLNRLVSTAYPDGTTISNLYNYLDIVGTKDRLNQWTYYGYDSVRQRVAETNANGQITLYGYCGCGSPDLISRLLGGRWINTSLNYDIAGRLINTVYADNYQVNRTYDDNNQLQSASDSGGRMLQLAYAQRGLKFKRAGISMLSLQSTPLLLVSNQFDEYGRVTNSVDRNAVTVTNAYDFLNRLVARQFFGNSASQESGLETLVYNSLGLTNYFDPLGNLTSYVRDAAGRILYETNANNEVLQFTYNPSGEMLSLIDGKNQQTAWNYDQYGRVTNKVDNTGAQMFAYQYDPNDRLTNRLQTGAIVTTYAYDPVGNLTNVTYPGSGVVIAYQYDDLNRLTNMLDAIGATAFSWTDGNQLAGETGPWANDAVSYSYTNRLPATLGLLQPGAAAWSQTYQYDEFARLTQVASPAGNFGYQYVSLAAPDGTTTVPNLVQQLTFPNNSYSRRIYDDLGRLTLTTLTGGATVYDQHGYQYDVGSRRTRQTFAAGNYQNYTYDNSGQLKSAQGYEANKGPARQQEQFGYAYDAAWNLSQRTKGSLVQSFSVNSLNELSSASRPANATITVSGSYENGNPPVSVAVNGTGLPNGPATVYADGTWAATNAAPEDGANTYTATATDNSGHVSSDTVTVNLPVNVNYQYDARGNLASDGFRCFAYDNENQLTSVWVTNTWRNDFLYDGKMRRRIRREYIWQGIAWVETNEVHYVYDGNLVIQERDGDNVPLVTYTRGNDLGGSLQGAGGIGGLLARTDATFNSPLATAYYHADGNCNVTCMINASNNVEARYSYDPYGGILAMSGPLANANTYRFSSKEWNWNSELYYYLYRFYDPNLQRWLNRDPIQEMGSINLYEFVLNVPTDDIDLYGFAPSGGVFNGLPSNAITTFSKPGFWTRAGKFLGITGILLNAYQCEQGLQQTFGSKPKCVKTTKEQQKWTDDCRDNVKNGIAGCAGVVAGVIATVGTEGAGAAAVGAISTGLSQAGQIIPDSWADKIGGCNNPPPVNSNCCK